MAHMHFDLPLSIATSLESVSDTQQTFSSEKKDVYLKMNSIISGAIKPFVLQTFELMQQRKEVEKYDFYYGKLHRKMNDRVCLIYISMLIRIVRGEAIWHYHEIREGRLTVSQLNDFTTKRIHMLGATPGLISFFIFLFRVTPSIISLGLKRFFRNSIESYG